MALFDYLSNLDGFTGFTASTAGEIDAYSACLSQLDPWGEDVPETPDDETRRLLAYKQLKLPKPTKFEYLAQHRFRPSTRTFHYRTAGTNGV